MSEEDREILVPPGEKGDKGDKGEQGMTPRKQSAIIYLFLVACLLAGAGLFWQGHETNENQAAQHREQETQRREGELIEQKLCITLASLAPLSELRAPAGNPATNPSRGFLQKLNHDLKPLADLGNDVGCPRK